MPDYDVLIAGGGPVGGALALALRGSGVKFALLEARPPDASRADPRPLALSYGSRLILDRLGLWQSLDTATPISRIHVSQRGGFGRVALDAAAMRLPALGYVVDYTRLAATTARECLGGGFDLLSGCTLGDWHVEAEAAVAEIEKNGSAQQCIARLLVVADGGSQPAVGDMSVLDYGQTAVTARIASAVPHNNVAYERFTPQGPLALLPAGEKLALIWTTAPQHAQDLCAASESVFLGELQQAFGDRLGSLAAVENRAVFPLVLKVARQIVSSHLARIGNAAQTLHPVAGQGLNLGLRDAWELATLLRNSPPAEAGTPGLLRSYAARRQLDRRGGIWFTHNLVRLFSSDHAPLRIARGLGLAALAAVPPAQEFLVRRMTFGARG